MNGRRLIALVVLAGLVQVGGCYKRTVSTRGIGSQNVNVREPYRSDTAADRWLDDILGRSKRPRSDLPRGDVPRDGGDIVPR